MANKFTKNVNKDVIKGISLESLGDTYTVYSALPLGVYDCVIANYITVTGDVARDIHGNVVNVDVVKTSVGESKVVRIDGYELSKTGQGHFIGDREPNNWFFVVKPHDYDFVVIPCKTKGMFDRQVNGLKAQLNILDETDGYKVIDLALDSEKLQVEQKIDSYTRDGVRKTNQKIEFAGALTLKSDKDKEDKAPSISIER